MIAPSINDKIFSNYAIHNIEFYYDHLGDVAATAESLDMSSSNLPVTVGVIIGFNGWSCSFYFYITVC